MSKTVDEKVVSMQFDNKQFENNVHTSLNTLDKLKKSLKLTDAAKGLEEVDKAAKKIDFSQMETAAYRTGFHIKDVFLKLSSVLEYQVARRLIAVGKDLVSAFTIDPIFTGLQEYETQINAVQTILANTQSKGTTLDQVNDALDELNHYADMTIYNFTEMTRNIGTFTAAGVDLDTSVSAIKGIANLAAVSGSTSQQASTAMYQLSQALAAGKVQLMDWNSVVNAGMGGQVFQDALKETARVHGIAIDDMIKNEGSFRETLQHGWLTSEILTETLSKFTGDLTEEQLKSMGYTEEQVKEIMKLGETANDAATKVKTFTQLVDTLKEAAQSGWTQTWEILIGDFEEAKKLWTGVSDYFSEILNKSAEARNNVLQAWSDAGGRDMIIDSLKNAFQGLLSVIKPIKEAFSEIFPSVTSEQLLKITKSIKEITAKFKLNEKASENLKNTFKGLFAILDIFLTVVKSIISAVSKLFGGITKLGGGILDVTGSLGEYVVGLRDSIKESGTFGNILSKIAEILNAVFSRFVEVIGYINQKLVAPGFKWFYSLLMGIGNVLKWIGSKINDVLSNLASGLKEAFSNGDLTNVTTLLGGGLLVIILKKVKDFVENLKNPLEGLSGIVDGVKEILGSVKDALTAWQQELQAKTLLKIAAAIAILAASILVISTIDEDRLMTSLGAITMLFAELMGALAIFAKIAGKITGVAKASLAMVSMSVSVLILAAALKTLSSINGEDLMKSLLGLAATFVILLAALTYMSKIDKMGKGAGKLLVIATSLVIFASGLKILATMSWDDIGRSLVAMAGVFVILLGAMVIMQKFQGMTTGAAVVLIVAGSLILMATALKIVGSMNWDQIAKSLVSVGATLLLITGVLAVMASLGVNAVIGAAAMVIMAAAINLLIPPLVILGLMSWESIGKGLVTLAGAFLILGVAGYTLGPVVPVILALSAAMALAGVGMLAFGAGMIAIGMGLTALATAFSTSGVIIIAGITAIITAIIGLIPSIIEAIGKGIILICDTIANSAKSIMGAVVAIITAVMDALDQSIPKIVTVVFNLLEALLSGLVEFTPKLVKAVFDILVACLDGIAAGLPRIVEAAVNVVVSFLNGIAEQLPRVVQAGWDLIIDFIDGMTASINTNTPRLVASIKALFKSIINAAVTVLTGGVVDLEASGGNLIEGLKKGITSKLSGLWDKVKSGFSSFKDKVKNFFGIHSPSTMFAEFGQYMDEGLVVGLNKYSGKVSDSAIGVGSEAADSMSKAISGISEAVDSDIDSQPTIRPVLDLSDVKSGAGAIAGMFGMQPSVGVLANVDSISSSMNRRQNGGTSDVVSAIESLGSMLSGQSSNVYNINGVTYDDGSNIAEAISTIVRAARIERRI